MQDMGQYFYIQVMISYYNTKATHIAMPRLVLRITYYKDFQYLNLFMAKVCPFHPNDRVRPHANIHCCIRVRCNGEGGGRCCALRQCDVLRIITLHTHCQLRTMEGREYKSGPILIFKFKHKRTLSMYVGTVYCRLAIIKCRENIEKNKQFH